LLISSSAAQVPFLNQPLQPANIAPGSADFTLTVDGTGFVSSSVVEWNGSTRPTAFISSSQLTASISASDVATAGTAQITVFNPSGKSNVQFFEVTTPTSPVASNTATFTTASEVMWMITADLNGDGKLDLITANEFDTVSVVLGNGDGTFQPATSYLTGPTGQGPDCVAAVDVNHDGKLDLVVLDAESGEISVLLGNGDGTFQAAAQFPVGVGTIPQSFVVADFNGDGNVDVVATSGSFVYALLGDGDGTFQQATQSPMVNVAEWITTGDFNHDGKLDVAVTSNFASDVFVLLGNGDGTFQNATSYSAGSSIAHLITADLNGDNALDLAVTNYNGSVSILMGNGDGTFQNAVSYAVGQAGSQLWAMTSADLNGDGKVDLVFSDGEFDLVYLLLGKGDGTFQPQLSYGSDPYGPLAAGDFNNDGRLDLALGSRGYSNGSILLQVPAVNLSASTLTFGTRSVGTISQAQSVTLTNQGSAPLMLSSISVSGTNSTDFFETNNCPSILNSSANCTLTLRFRPTNKGFLSASLSISDNAPGSPQTVTLTGTGTFIQLTPSSLGFGNQPVGTTSLPKKMRMTNIGKSTVSVDSILIAGTNAGDFTQINTCGKTILAGASCTISVTFTPSAKGARSASISATDNGGGSPQRAALSGTGT